MKKFLLFFPIITFLFFSTGSVLAQQNSPILSEPPNLDHVVQPTVTFRWQDLTGVLSYTFDIAVDPLFATETGTGITCNTNDHTCAAGELSSFTTYYWRVRGNYPEGPGPYSSTFSFTTAGTPVQELDYLRNIVNNLAASSQLTDDQATMLNNKLNQ